MLEIIEFLLAIGIGLGSGSYATMPYYRLPNNEPCGGKWTGKRSHCTSCGHKLRTRDLLPVFNWLLTHGKCQFCGKKISPVYFFIELSCTILSVLIYLKFGFSDKYMLFMILAVCLVILSATDYSYKTLPDAVFIVIVMVGMTYRAIEDSELFGMTYGFTLALLTCLFYRQIYEKITGKKIKNYGYLKLITVSGIWLTPGNFVAFIIVAALFMGMLRLVYGKKRARFAMPIAASLLLFIFYPNLHLAVISAIPS